MLLAIVFGEILLVIHPLIVLSEQAPHARLLGSVDALEELFFQLTELVDHRAIHLEVFGSVLAFVVKFAMSHAVKRQPLRHGESRIDEHAGNASQHFTVESAHRRGDDEIGFFVGHQLSEKRHRLSRHDRDVRCHHRHVVGIELVAQHDRRAVVPARGKTVEKEYFFHRVRLVVATRPCGSLREVMHFRASTQGQARKNAPARQRRTLPHGSMRLLQGSPFRQRQRALSSVNNIIL